MASRGRTSSFTRKAATPSLGASPSPCTKPGPHGTFLTSSGFADLDNVIGGGFPVGSIVLIMEDIDAPHHLLLLRYFIAQGLVHGHPLLFGSNTFSPEAFLGTLPGLSKLKEAPNDRPKSSEGEGLRIAWQYRKFIDEQQSLEDRRLQQQKLIYEAQGTQKEYCSTFDIKKPVERSLLTSSNIECINLQSGINLQQLQEKCKSFCSQSCRPDQKICRIAFQSLCSPQGFQYDNDWEMLQFLHTLKGLVRNANAVAFITFPASLMARPFSLHWQHMADIVLSVEAVPDDNKDMAALLTDYNDIVGFLRVLRLPSINTQVPMIPESTVYALKFLRKRTLKLDKLNQAPIDASGGDSYNKPASSVLCGTPQNSSSPLDF